MRTNLRAAQLLALAALVGLPTMLFVGLASAEAPELEAEQSQAEPQQLQHVRVCLAPMSFDWLAQRADAVVRGRIATKTPVFAQDDRVIPVTHYLLEVVDPIKGDVGEVVEFLIAGAQTATRSFNVENAPQLQVGDEYALFLQASPDRQRWGVLGLTYGTFRVSGQGSTARVSGASLAGPESVFEFKNRVLRAVEAGDH